MRPGRADRCRRVRGPQGSRSSCRPRRDPGARAPSPSGRVPRWTRGARRPRAQPRSTTGTPRSAGRPTASAWPPLRPPSGRHRPAPAGPREPQRSGRAGPAARPASGPRRSPLRTARAGSDSRPRRRPAPGRRSPAGPGPGSRPPLPRGPPRATLRRTGGQRPRPPAGRPRSRSGSARTLARSISESKSGSVAEPEPAAATSSSVNSGLPPDRSWMRAASWPSAVAPRIASTCIDVSSGDSGSSVSIVVRGLRPSSAIQPRSEWPSREVLRSERQDQEDALVPEVVEEERDQVARRRIGRLDILEHDGRRPLHAHPAQRVEQLVEQPRLRLTPVEVRIVAGLPVVGGLRGTRRSRRARERDERARPEPRQARSRPGPDRPSG